MKKTKNHKKSKPEISDEIADWARFMTIDKIFPTEVSDEEAEFQSQTIKSSLPTGSSRTTQKNGNKKNETAFASEVSTEFIQFLASLIIYVFAFTVCVTFS